MSTDERENKFYVWETNYDANNEHTYGYYYRQPAEASTYQTDMKIKSKYNKDEWNSSALICSAMMKSNRSQVVRNDASFTETHRPKALLRTNSSESFVNFLSWNDTDIESMRSRMKDAFESFMDENSHASVKDVRKIVKQALGDDAPNFVVDKYCVLAWKASAGGRITWNDFYNFIPRAVKAVEADCSVKRELPPLVKLMNRPRIHDKNLGPFSKSTTIYQDTYDFDGKTGQQELYNTLNAETNKTTNNNASELMNTTGVLTKGVKANRLMVLNPATSMLACGTTKLTSQMPGYLGHIPRNVRNDRKIQHSDGRYTHPTINNLMLTQRGMGAMLGYSGYIPLPSLHVKFNERVTGCDTVTTTGAGYVLPVGKRTILG